MVKYNNMYFCKFCGYYNIHSYIAKIFLLLHVFPYRSSGFYTYINIITKKMHVKIDRDKYENYEYKNKTYC